MRGILLPLLLWSCVTGAGGSGSTNSPAGGGESSLKAAKQGRSFEIPISIDAAAVGFAHERQPLPVNVRAANPALVFALVQRNIGSAYAPGDMVMNLKLGQGLQSGAPLIWNRYLDVRTGGDSSLPTIEMDIADAQGGNTLDFSNLSAPTLSSAMQLTLTCRLLDAAGHEVERFSSPQKFSHSTQNLQDPAAQPDVPKMIARAFDEILPRFFSSAKVIAALPASAAPPTAPTRGVLAVLDLRNKLTGAAREQVDTAYLTDVVRSAALDAAPGLQIMTRENVLVLLKASGKSLSECEGECEVDTGRRLGADLIISGEVLQFGSNLKINLKLHETGQGRLLSASQASGGNADGLDREMPGAIRKLMKPLSR